MSRRGARRPLDAPCQGGRSTCRRAGHAPATASTDDPSDDARPRQTDMAPPRLTLTLPDLAWRQRRMAATDEDLGPKAAGSPSVTPWPPSSTSVDRCAAMPLPLWPSLVDNPGRSPTGWTYTDEDGMSHDQPAWITYERLSAIEPPVPVVIEPTPSDLSGAQEAPDPPRLAFPPWEVTPSGGCCGSAPETVPESLSAVGGGHNLASAFPLHSDGFLGFKPLSSQPTSGIERPAEDWPQDAWLPPDAWEKPSIAPVWPTAALQPSGRMQPVNPVVRAADLGPCDCAPDATAARPPSAPSEVSTLAPGSFADYEESLRAQVYGCLIAGDLPLATSSWSTPERSHTGSLRLLTDLVPAASGYLSQYGGPASSSAPGGGAATGGLEAWLSAPAYDSHYLSPCVPSCD